MRTEEQVKSNSNLKIQNDRMVHGDQILGDFIVAHMNLVDKELFNRFVKGDTRAVNETLNRIYWRSMKDGEAKELNLSRHESYVEVVKKQVHPEVGRYDCAVDKDISSFSGK